MIKKTGLGVFFSVVAFAIAAPERTITLESASGETSFLAVGYPSALKIHGKAPGPQGTITLLESSQKQTVARTELELDLDQLDTGIKLRNSHMKKNYLHTEQHPKAKLVIQNLTIPGSIISATQDMTFPFEGQLTLHGKTQTVSGSAKFISTSQSVEASFPIKLSDFEIDVPKYAGITVAQDVSVDVKFPLKLN